MIPLPDKIEICPINEAILEIRYSSDFPKDAIFGIVYSVVKDFFPDKPVPLPILQLPETVREQDPNLQYKPHHTLKKDNIVFNIGPKVLTFSNISPYIGWTEWSKFFYSIYEKVKTTEVISSVERIGLRYINIFKENIFDKVKLEINLIDNILNDESTTFRTEIIDGELLKVLQIGNSLNIIRNNKPFIGSVIDIDCIYQVNDSADFFANFYKIIETAHIKEKDLFFSLLEKSFLEELKPTYGELQ